MRKEKFSLSIAESSVANNNRSSISRGDGIIAISNISPGHTNGEVVPQDCENELPVTLKVPMANDPVKNLYYGDEIARFPEGEDRPDKSGEGFDGEEWMNKLKEMRDVYEKAISGYKEELEMSVAQVASLQNQLQSLKQVHKADKDVIAQNYKMELEKIKNKNLTEVIPTQVNETENRKDFSELQNLRLLLKEKDKDIQHLKEFLSKIDAELLKKFEEFILHNFLPSQTNCIVDRMKVALEEWWKEHRPRIDEAFERSQSSMIETDFTKLQEMTLNKLEKAVCNLSEDNLDKLIQEVQAKDTKLLNLNSEISTVNLTNEELRMKIKSLESEIEIKNKILEKNSNQLETRIREYSFLSSQLEQLRSKHAKEIALLKALNEDSRLKPSLQELQLQKDRLETQLNFIKNEKQMTEKDAQRRIKILENQITQYKIQNGNLQFRLQRIERSYDSLFHSVHSLPADFGVVSRPLRSNLLPSIPALSNRISPSIKDNSDPSLKQYNS